MSFSEIFYALEFAALILAAVSAVGFFVVTLIGAVTECIKNRKKERKKDNAH